MYIFNPEHDLALGNFGVNYTPPESAVKLASDLALLPVWYAPDGELIVAGGAANADYLRTLQSILPIRSEAIPFTEIPSFAPERIIPWGWNPLLRQQLIKAGVSRDLLPSMEELARLREYSGRQHAARLLRELLPQNDVFCGGALFFTRLYEVQEYLSSFSGDKVLKMPNSGSGKGLIWIKGEITDKQIDWCRRVIATQGGIVAEPVYDKQTDLAMEFSANHGKVTFECYSLFESASSGAYAGNRLLTDKQFENEVSKFIDVSVLYRLREQLTNRLAEYFPEYEGPMGVDMMICRTEEGFRLHPCVEINMRMNMGLVARRFFDRFVHPDSEGMYRIGYFKREGEASKICCEQKKAFPLEIDHGKISSGYLPLTPVNETTRYVAWSRIFRKEEIRE
jgi:hypothetical protein